MEMTAALKAHFKLLIVGGGAGGLGTASKFSRYLPRGSVGVVEPKTTHYYQPGLTLVGSGLMSLASNRRAQSSLIPANSTWIQDSVTRFDPDQNCVVLRNGENITYDFLVVANGVELRFDKIKGCVEALETPGVCSNYSPKYAEKHLREVLEFKGGNAIFTFPNAPIKCAGAPQKACYLTESLFEKMQVRSNANVIYATSLGRLFGVEPYASTLEHVAREKGVEVRTRRELVEVRPDCRLAVFEILDECGARTGRTEELEYSLLHVGPPCAPPESLSTSKLADKSGFLDVNPQTLQSKHFSNVFGVGDCMNTGNAKTAAAVSSHLKTLEKNLKSVMKGNDPRAEYDGYASCPLVTSPSTAMLAEFNSNGPLETTPFDQSTPSWWAYLMKRHLMPVLYWHGLLKGRWNGPATMRRITRACGFKRN